LDVLDRLTGDAQTFVEQAWASRIHVHRSEPGAFGELLSIDDVDHLLTAAGLRTPAFRVVQDGTVLPSARFTRSATIAGVAVSGLADPRKLLDLFDAGATIVLQGLHRYWPPITGLVRELELALGHACQANAYLTPPGSQGFGLHSDTHDVFVLQTYGTKQWQLQDESGEHAVLLEPGVSMYLPTGTPHAARTERGVSLHLTIGINRTTWRETVTRAVATLLADDSFDEPLPAGYHRDAKRFSALLATRLAGLRDLVEKADVNTLASTETQRFLTTRPTSVRAGLLDRLQIADVSDSARLRRRPASVCELRAAGDRLQVLLGDRELRMPGWLAPPLEWIQRTEVFRPSDLSPWLDEASRLVLCRRLIREGLLEVVR
jgi:bifunctional lysine-specific demethylase and histidyl-hydroxylase NO66